MLKCQEISLEGESDRRDLSQKYDPDLLNSRALRNSRCRGETT
jgi:hypothetical protein